LTLRVAVGPSTKSKSSVLVLGDDFVDDSIHAAVAKHEAITLASVKIFATADEKPPGSTLNLEHLGAITASEVAPIGLFLVLTCTDDVAQAPQPQVNASPSRASLCRCRSSCVRSRPSCMRRPAARTHPCRASAPWRASSRRTGRARSRPAPSRAASKSCEKCRRGACARSTKTRVT